MRANRLHAGEEAGDLLQLGLGVGRVVVVRRNHPAARLAWSTSKVTSFCSSASYRCDLEAVGVGDVKRLDDIRRSTVAGGARHEAR